ncbi:TetR family transcriptional regulator [Hahella sp. CCB-MM4]|uniref:TetR/AcrR family transcriptional regulator n=1 Tax=Hahella sp. (strain CCB-MM4) TaxID=1926491 RepID=UPI000B9AD576|nr:TetR/AcrR family transcriptional regulator [Hahella sp. CCB-MM4]OZG73123.1 TetR family transcriptional regulator [Hahella sp. CCB-MM4]
MARASKKDFIVQTATGVFLENGFKGTSIDMVVSACQVSKPTVYNHFPDKSELISAVVERWMQLHPVTLDEIFSEIHWEERLATSWWNDEAISLYRLVIGEGWRFENTAERFWQEYDAKWRDLAITCYKHLEIQSMTDDHLQAWISHQLWSRLRPA